MGWWPVACGALLLLACSGRGSAGPTSTASGPTVTPSLQGSATPAPTEPAPVLGTVVPRPSLQANRAELELGDGVVSVPLFEDGLVWSPKVEAGDGVILVGSASAPDEFGEHRYVLFDPATGSRTLLWTGEPDRQDAIFTSHGEWLATIRTGPELPFPDWQLLLRNWVTGEVREVAASDPAVVEYPGLHPGLPLGLAPTPVVRDGYVVWEEHFVHEDGVGKRVQRYNIATELTTTLREIADARLEDLRLPTASGTTAAWIHLMFEDETAERADIIVELLDGSGSIRKLVLPGEAFQIALSSDAGTLYWATLGRSQYATDLASLATTALASGIGNAFVYVSGTYVGWPPNTQVGATTVGYYDETTDTTHTLFIDGLGERSTLAWPLGKWFAWNVLVHDDAGNNDYVASSLYFLPLE